MEVKCEICDKTFNVSPSRIKYGRGKTCSKECQNELVSKKMNKQIHFECVVCGKGFSRSPSHVKNTKYTNVCSRKCMYEARTLGIIKREVEKKYNLKPLPNNTKCLSCDKEFRIIPSRIKDEKRGKYCSMKCYNKAKSVMMKGENNRFYIDGRSYEKNKFRGTDWNIIRERTIKRDNFRCVNCGIDREEHLINYKQDLHVHHIIPYKVSKNNELSNLKTLCVPCHSKEEYKERTVILIEKYK